MRNIQLLLITIWLMNSIYGQKNISVPEMGLNFKSYTVKDKQLGPINFYLSTDSFENTKPLLVFLDGSGNFPLFRIIKDGKSMMIIQSVSAPIFDKIAQYNLLLISKPNVPFSDTFTVKNLDSLKSTHSDIPNLGYDSLLSFDWRVKATSLAINYVINHNQKKYPKVTVMGYSEGARVAPKVALINKNVTNVVCFVSGGLNQFYDYIIAERFRADKGEITYEESQRNIDSLYSQFEAIYKDPKDTKRTWEGHTYLRWSSFCSDVPLNDMVKLNIPIYIAKGTNDKNSEVLSYDYVKLEFLRLGKTNLTYVNYAGADHGFNKSVIKDGQLENTNEIDKAFNTVFRWIKAN